MNKIILYLSGPMTGLPGYNFPAFTVAARRLREAGFTILNPAEYGVDETMTHSDYLRRDLHDVLNADGVALLPGWEQSKGATLEVYVARALGMPVQLSDEWITASAVTLLANVDIS